MGCSRCQIASVKKLSARLRMPLLVETELHDPLVALLDRKHWLPSWFRPACWAALLHNVSHLSHCASVPFVSVPSSLFGRKVLPGLRYASPSI